MRNIEEPVLHGSKTDTLGQHETHPAYGQISVSRVSGGAFLYGSDFEHQHYVTLSISESKLNRSLSRDWPFSGKEIIQVAMTEAQWATFVSSFNQGGGVQCTLQRREGVGMVPGIPEPKRADKYREEFAEDMQSIVDDLKKLMADLEAGTTGLSKKKAEELMASTRRALRTAESSAPFVNEQFEEHMETVIERSKVEVEGYLNARIQRLGLQALQQQRAGDINYLVGGTENA